MKNWLKIAGFAAAAALVTLLACKKNTGDTDNDGNSNGYDRAAMLTNYADGYIIPAYTQMSEQLAVFKSKIDDFAAAPTATKLTGLQESWKNAYFLWQKVEMMEFGPEQTTALRMYMNIYPVTVSKINNNISTGSYNLEQFGNTDAQGFPALDYLLNGLAADNAAILAFYTTDGQAANRKQYLQAVANKMHEKINAVRSAWTTGGYRNTFVTATGTDVQSSLSLMVNAFVLHYERYLRSGKIGLPVGAMTGVAAPELSEAYYSPALGKELALAALTAVNNYYEGMNFSGGENGQGFKDYLAAIGTKDEADKLMADLITDELAQARSALTALNTPIREAVNNNRPSVLNIYTELQQVVPLFKVDMVSSFGISITYVDNDGD
jgi:predicted lipoprotein